LYLVQKYKILRSFFFDEKNETSYFRQNLQKCQTNKIFLLDFYRHFDKFYTFRTIFLPDDGLSGMLVKKSDNLFRTRL